MPVIDGVFEPRSPLALAETHVHFANVDAHVIGQRERIERTCQPALLRLQTLAAYYPGVMPLVVLDDLTARLRRGLDRTASFGFRSAQAEVRRLRQARRETLRAYSIPDAGEHARDALDGIEGIEGIRRLIGRRSREAASNVTQAVNKAAATPGLTAEERAAAIVAAGRRALHNNVLELVGETLNMGRTAGALALPNPPEFAMRSEQLDKQTCDPCDRVHGEIAEVGSNDYFQLLPPSYCLGGGRCRGVMVFGDGPVDLTIPLPEAA